MERRKVCVPCDKLGNTFKALCKYNLALLCACRNTQGSKVASNPNTAQSRSDVCTVASALQWCSCWKCSALVTATKHSDVRFIPQPRFEFTDLPRDKNLNIRKRLMTSRAPDICLILQLTEGEVHIYIYRV